MISDLKFAAITIAIIGVAVIGLTLLMSWLDSRRAPHTYSGMDPTQATCSWPMDTALTRKLCVSHGTTYLCVRESGGEHWECAIVTALPVEAPR